MYFVGVSYDKIIIQVLVLAKAEGMSVKDISRYVYNQCNSLFAPIHYEEVHKYVSSYLLRNSKRSDSFIERDGKRGKYRLNLQSQESQQLMLEFEEQSANEPISSQENVERDDSLCLF